MCKLFQFLWLIIFLMIGCHPQLQTGSNMETAQKNSQNEKVITANQPEGTWLLLTQKSASNFARLALKCIQKEYPNKLGHVINNSNDVKAPKVLHPVFYGCFDWHSAVHGHWMLVRLLQRFPGLPEAKEIRAALHDNLTAENVLQEVAYFQQPNRKSFERTYGWAWLLKFAEELHSWDDPDARQWSKNLQPLVRTITDRYLDFLPRQTYPIRTGVHPNTAFGIAFALDYAQSTGNAQLKELLIKQGMKYYGKDSNAPASWEPGGEDFFSPALMEADLMRRIMKPTQFKEWLQNFIPHPANLLQPVLVTDRSDPKIVHLDGLNLSRAWCMFSIASVFPKNDSIRNIFIEAAILHAKQTLPHITSGNYEGEHWLASFAIYMFLALDQLQETE